MGGRLNNLDKENILRTWKSTLRDRGYRVTGPRKLVMDIIASASTALSPQEIYEISIERKRSLGIASVYRTVEMLAELDLVEHIHQPDGCHGIWPVIRGHNHHLVCRSCGQVRVIPGEDTLGRYFADVETMTEYRVDGHWLQLFGLCPGCRRTGQGDEAGQDHREYSG